MLFAPVRERRDGSRPRDRLATLGALVDAVTAAELAVSREPDAGVVLDRERRPTHGTCYNRPTASVPAMQDINSQLRDVGSCSDLSHSNKSRNFQSSFPGV